MAAKNASDLQKGEITAELNSRHEPRVACAWAVQTRRRRRRRSKAVPVESEKSAERATCTEEESDSSQTDVEQSPAIAPASPVSSVSQPESATKEHTRAPAQCRKIFIGGVSAQTSVRHLKVSNTVACVISCMRCKVYEPTGADAPALSMQDHFSQFGALTDVVIMFDENSRRTRNFGFVTFAQPSAAADALRNHFHLIRDRWVEVKLAIPRNEMDKVPKEAYDDTDCNSPKQTVAQTPAWGAVATCAAYVSPHTYQVP